MTRDLGTYILKQIGHFSFDLATPWPIGHLSETSSVAAFVPAFRVSLWLRGTAGARTYCGWWKPFVNRLESAVGRCRR
jgi:hypothetical protein